MGEVGVGIMATRCWLILLVLSVSGVLMGDALAQRSGQSRTPRSCDRLEKRVDACMAAERKGFARCKSRCGRPPSFAKLDNYSACLKALRSLNIYAGYKWRGHGFSCEKIVDASIDERAGMMVTIADQVNELNTGVEGFERLFDPRARTKQHNIIWRVLGVSRQEVARFSRFSDCRRRCLKRFGDVDDGRYRRCKRADAKYDRCRAKRAEERAGIYISSTGRGRPRVRLGQPVVSGAIEPSAIKRVIHRSVGKFRFCYLRQLQQEPSLAGGVTVKFSVNSRGRVSLARAVSDTASPKELAVGRCFARILRRIRFPRPRGGASVSVSYPFTLTPK